MSCPGTQAVGVALGERRDLSRVFWSDGRIYGGMSFIFLPGGVVDHVDYDRCRCGRMGRRREEREPPHRRLIECPECGAVE